MTNGQTSGRGNISDQVSVVVVDALALSLTEKFKQLHLVSKERCIYRVPKRLKELNEKAYTPQYVSIGPYHHGKDELKAMEEHKIMYLQHFLRLSKVSLKEFICCIMANETNLRNCYQERIDLSSERFVGLMLVDAAFVIMVILRILVSEFNNEDDLLFNKPRMILDIKSDMILLENQLPFFILEKILVLSKLAQPSSFLNMHRVQHYSMVHISSHFLKGLFPSWVVNPPGDLNFSESKHLVDFLRIGQRPLEQNKNKYKALDVVNLPSAVELYRAGVKFRRCSSLRLIDINFRDGILEIPLLKLDDSTDILFRNLLIFERSILQISEGYLNDYIFMISLLVTNGQDVEILTKKGIIEDLLRGNEQVVHLVHNLCKQTFINSNKFYFSDVVNDLNKYYNKKCNRWRASLKRKYFYNPWAIISFIAGTFVILLTIVQTILSFLKVKQH